MKSKRPPTHGRGKRGPEKPKHRPTRSGQAEKTDERSARKPAEG